MFHIQGHNLSEESFSDNYSLLDELNIISGHIDEDPEEERVDNVFISIYDCPKKCTLEEAQENVILSTLGLLEIETQDYGYSEYTIEGFSVYSMKLGGHDILKILESKRDRYLHVLIEKK